MESGSQFYIKDTKEGTPRDILGKEYYQRKRLNAEPSIAGNMCFILSWNFKISLSLVIIKG